MVAGVLAICLPMFAHHGTQAYNPTRVQMKGVTVTDVFWANPHCIVRFDAKDESGKVVHWAGEMSSPSALLMFGFTKPMLKPGDVITVDITVSKTGNPVGWVRRITFADGSVMPQDPKANL